MTASPEALKTAQDIVQKQADKNVISQAKIAGAVPYQGVAEGNRFDEPLTGYHIVYKNSGNPVLNTPSFETKDQAQKYLMTKMFANHQDFKVVHTANIGMAEMDKSAPQPGRDGKVSHKTYGSRDNYKLGDPERTGKPISTEKAKKDALDILKKQGVAEGMSQTPFTDEELVAINQYLDDDLSFQELKTYPGLIRKIAKYLDIASIQGHMGEMNFYDRLVQAREEGDIPQQGVAEGSFDYAKRGKELDASTKKIQANADRRIRGKELDASVKNIQTNLDKRIKKTDKGVAEGMDDSPVADAMFARLQQRPDLLRRYGVEYVIRPYTTWQILWAQWMKLDPAMCLDGCVG